MSAAPGDTPEAEALWLELPPISSTAPRRLIVFLHGAGSSAERFAPVAIAWMLKFPGATGAILHALRPASVGAGGTHRRGRAAGGRTHQDAAADHWRER
jgi:predicted esterase